MQNNAIPGVMQFESNLSSFGKICPFSIALRMLSSASLAELLEENQVNVCCNRYNLQYVLPKLL